MKITRFNRTYFLLSLLLIGVEVFIGARMHDALIRPYGGDLLCVILLYCLIRTCWRLPVLPLVVRQKRLRLAVIKNNI